MNRRALLGLLAALPVAIAACGAPPRPSFKATDVTGADFGRKLALTDHHGKPRALEDFKGKAIVVFFGYTQCPDVCPTTMSTLKEVRERLGADGKRLQVLFVTVDPERDTGQVLASYVPSFDPDFQSSPAASALMNSMTAIFVVTPAGRPVSKNVASLPGDMMPSSITRSPHRICAQSR